VLTGLLLCANEQDSVLLRRALEARSILVDSCTSSDSARRLLESNHYDVCVYDLRVNGIRLFLEKLATADHQRCFRVAVTDHSNEEHRSLRHAASLIYFRPLTSHKLERSLAPLLAMLSREHLGKRRHTIDVPVWLQIGSQWVEGQGFNLGIEGMSVQLAQETAVRGSISFELTLPRDNEAVHGRADATVGDKKGEIALRFTDLPTSARALLHRWHDEQNAAAQRSFARMPREFMLATAVMQ